MRLYVKNREMGSVSCVAARRLEDGEDPGHFRHLKLRGACSTKVNAVLFPLPEASEQTCPTFGMYVRPVTGFWSTGTHLKKGSVGMYCQCSLPCPGALRCFALFYLRIHNSDVSVLHICSGGSQGSHRHG